MRLTVWCLLLGLGVALPARAQDIATGLFGRTVASVAYTGDGPVDRSEIVDLIAIRQGQPLTESLTGATIRNLYGTRLFSNVVVQAEPAAGETVDVTVHLWLAYRIGRLEFHGKSSLSGDDLRRAVPLAAGDVFNAAALAAGTAAIERRLVADGYLHPSVDPEAEFDPATFAVTLVYNVAAGARARMTAPFFDGATAPFTAADLAARSKLKEGSPYQEAKARAGADRIRKYLLEQGHFRATVELIAAEPTEDGRIRPVLRIAVGPRYTLEVEGMKEKAARRQILALLEAQGFDDDLMEQWTLDRRQELQKQGHYRAKVTVTKTAGADAVVLRLAIEPGPRYAVEKIAFSGNGSVDDRTLRDLMVARKKGLPFLQKGRLLDTDLEGDTSAILGYYQSHGWIDARVEKPVVTAGSRPDRLDVTIKIVEGPRVIVARRDVEGADVLEPAEIERLVTVKTGEPFNRGVVRQDVASLTTWYRNNGWPSASVRDRLTLSTDRTKVDVAYVVDEGLRAFFGKTIVRGNAVTNSRRILRQVAWKEGEPFSEEKIADTQQNLARTGVFRSIEVQPQPAEAETQERNVEIELAEARRISLLYGFGYQYAPGAAENRNDIFGVVGGTYRNLFGTLRSASLEVQYAPLSQRGHVFASFLEPYLFDTEFPLTVVGFASRAPIQDIDIDRVGGYVESVRLFHKDTRVGLRYEYQQISPRNPEDLSTIELEKFPKSDQPIKQSAIGPSLFYDRRDDILDPHRGYYGTVAGKYAFPFLSATARYAKVSGQAAWFQELLGGVLGVSGRAGAIFPYDLALGVPVPIAERFFAGGSATGRGFATDLLGISGVTVDNNTQATLHTGSGDGSCAATYPGVTAYDCSPGPRIIGGNGFMAWSVEWRYPILGPLGVSLFYDLAQVWENPGDINLRIEGERGLRQSIGAGLHYMTPIGPLRLEYGLPLVPRTIDFEVTSTVKPDGSACNPSPCLLANGSTKESGRILLSIGYPF